MYDFLFIELDVNITIPSKRRIWSPAEISALKEHFGDKIALRKYPSAKEMNTARLKDSRLSHREVPLIRAWFCNQYNKKKKTKA